MNLARCPYGHVFNPIPHRRVCPYCKIKREKVQGNYRPESYEVLSEALPKERLLCGWLVCIAGAKTGRDYPIYSGKSFIGYNEDMDIQITADGILNLCNHGIICYDLHACKLMLQPEEPKGFVYLGDRPVEGLVEVEPFNVIGLGKSRFLFVPLCGDNFAWDDFAR